MLIQIHPILFAILLSLFITDQAEAGSTFKVPITSKLLRAQELLQATGLESKSVNAHNQNGLLKVVTAVQCGNDQQFQNVLIDTGSAILWLGGESPYTPGPNAENLNTSFSVGYGAGGVSGSVFFDTVTIGEATAQKVFVGSANSTNGFSLVKPIDGILGLGPAGSNNGEIFGFNATPTFVQSLLHSHVISQPMFGISINPLSTDGVPEGSGEITFGGFDPEKFSGEIAWIPQNAPVDFHWEFNMSSMTFGTVSLNQSTFARTDTGTLLMGLPFDTFFDIINAYNASILTSGSLIDSVLTFPSNLTFSLPSLDFQFGTVTISIPPSGYIVPAELFPTLNITGIDPSKTVVTWIASAGFGEFMVGQKILEFVYSVYDMKNHLIGFAKSSLTD